MVLQAREAAAQQRLVVTASSKVSEALTLEAIGAPVEFLIASRELLGVPGGVEGSWGTTGVYVLAGGPETALGPGDPLDAYDKLLKRAKSEEPPTEPGLKESLDEHQHTEHWRARVYTGLSRDLLRRMGEHAAKPWWNRALLCRQAPPWPYGIDDVGYLEGRLHETLETAFWLKRVGRTTSEEAILSNRADALEAGHLPSVLVALRLFGLALDSEEQVAELAGAGSDEA
jgi:hypothetical protein